MHCFWAWDLYCLVRLRDTEGGDEPRFMLLAGLLNAKLVGRSGLPSETLGLMRALVASRHISISLPEQAWAYLYPFRTVEMAFYNRRPV